MRDFSARHLAPVLALFVLTLPAIAQGEKKVLTLDDYGKWSRITSTSISDDGRWMTFAYDPNDGDTVLHVKQVDGEKVHEIRGGGRPAFAADSRWCAFLVSPGEKEQEKLRQAKKPVTRTCELVGLGSDLRRKFAGAESFSFAETAKHLAVLKRRSDPKAKHRGADLLLVDLTGEGLPVHNIGNVAEYSFNESGTLLAWVVDAADEAGNGAYLLDLMTGRIGVLDSHDERRYSKLRWGEKTDDVAFLRGAEVKGMEETANEVFTFVDVAVGGGRRLVYRPERDKAFPKGYVVSEHRTPAFSRDGGRLFVGIRQQRKKVDAKAEKGAKKKAPRSNVEVWHWKDERLQSVQKVRQAADRRSTHLAVIHLGDRPKLVRLANAAMRGVTTSDHERWAIGRDDSKYRGDMTADRGRADYYRIDMRTGKRQRIARAVRRGMGGSPDGRWLLYSRKGEIFAYDVERGGERSLSKLAGVDFTNREADRPQEKPSYGVAGYTLDCRAVILNHRFDLWLVPLTGDAKARNITRGIGARRKIRFRHVQLDPEARTIDLGARLVLSAYGERTKRSGYWELHVGHEPRPLHFPGKSISSLRKATHAERVLFQQQTFVESPAYFVADTRMRSRRKMTDANPQQSKFAWSPGRVLIDYVDKRGNELQATLTLPAGYEKGKRYPTLVYFYEKMSQRHHQYSMPSYDDRPHMSTYASDGYAVLMPDIVYEDGKPGSSALDDVGSAVRKAIELGYVDPKRVGLQGHSWGGYQSSFMVTQTDMFACVVTGAPLTNMISMHNVLYKRTGNANAGLIQWGQGRMATDPWSDLAAYVEQSPMHNAAKIRTPFMILHGTDDGAVDWNQGLEFYIAAKRLGKEVVLLSYPGEPHHLRRKENQKDFQRRMKQYFDHYLKGRKAPEWLRKGLPWLDRDRETRK